MITTTLPFKLFRALIPIRDFNLAWWGKPEDASVVHIGSGTDYVLQCPDCHSTPEVHLQEGEILVRCDKCRQIHAVRLRQPFHRRTAA